MPLPSAETTPPVTKTYFVGTRAHGRRPHASSSRSTGVRSISSPSERRSPRRVRPASAPIATQRPLPVKRLTEFNPSSAPRPLAPRVSEHRHLAEIVGSSRTASAERRADDERGREVRLERAARVACRAG